MVVERQPFTQTARVVAWLLAAICLTAGGTGVALGMARANLRLALAAAGVLGRGAVGEFSCSVRCARARPGGGGLGRGGKVPRWKHEEHCELPIRHHGLG